MVKVEEFTREETAVGGEGNSGRLSLAKRADRSWDGIET